jgi:hypothetical protein
MVSAEYVERGCLKNTMNLIFSWSNPIREGRLKFSIMGNHHLLALIFVIGFVAVYAAGYYFYTSKWNQ